MRIWTQADRSCSGVDVRAAQQLAHALVEGRRVYVRCPVPAWEDALFAAIRDALWSARDAWKITEERYEAALGRLYSLKDGERVPEGAVVVEVRASEPQGPCVIGFQGQNHPMRHQGHAALR
ncbi:hypothetical protein [Alicyclobacillus sendaiensis]|uniref:hypothetical protein n=1 Tax=Alicyclobacillus sendaiensis TaxID=192387 RepID=UPI0009FAAF5D|nr:hypothetical protein [Alicyclobacillus sendaiensis]